MLNDFKMQKNYFLNKFENGIKRRPIIFIMILFLSLSFLTIVPYFLTGYFYVHIDGTFHLSRVEELSEDIKQGVFFPGIATHTFNQIGDIVMSCYPYFTLYPLAFLMLIFKPVEACFFGIMLIIFLTLSLSYLSMRLIGKSRLISLFFSTLYSLTVYVSMELLYLNHYGEMLSYPFFPLIFAGFYLIIFGNYKKWFWLVLGMTGVIYSHLVSTLVVSLVLLTLYLSIIRLQKRGERLIRFGYIIISAIVTFLLSLPVIVPLLLISMSSKLNLPSGWPLSLDNVNLANLITQSMSNNISSLANTSVYNIGFLLVLILIFGIFFINKVTIFARDLYIISIIVLFVTTDLFPLQLISDTPILKSLEAIQGTRRIVPFFIMFLSAFGAFLIKFVLQKYNRWNIKSFFKVTIFALLLTTSFNTSNVSNNFSHFGKLNYKITQQNRFPSQEYDGSPFPFPAYKFNNSEYLNQFSAFNFAPGDGDYLPSNKNTFDVQNKTAILNRKKFSISRQSIRPFANGIKYNLFVNMVKNTEIDLPFLKYNKMNYRVLFNNKVIKRISSSSRGTIEFSIPYHVKHATISIQYLGNGIIKASFLIALLTWVLFLIYVLIDKKKFLWGDSHRYS